MSLLVADSDDGTVLVCLGLAHTGRKWYLEFRHALLRLLSLRMVNKIKRDTIDGF